MAARPLSMPDGDGLPTPARYYAMAVVILGIAMSVLDGTIVNLALPKITRDLHASAAQAIWVINAYQIAILAFLLPCAALGDLVGYRRVYLGGLSLFGVHGIVLGPAIAALFIAAWDLLAADTVGPAAASAAGLPVAPVIAAPSATPAVPTDHMVTSTSASSPTTVTPRPASATWMIFSRD